MYKFSTFELSSGLQAEIHKLLGRSLISRSNRWVDPPLPRAHSCCTKRNQFRTHSKALCASFVGCNCHPQARETNFSLSEASLTDCVPQVGDGSLHGTSGRSRTTTTTTMTLTQATSSQPDTPRDLGDEQKAGSGNQRWN